MATTFCRSHPGWVGCRRDADNSGRDARAPRNQPNRSGSKRLRCSRGEFCCDERPVLPKYPQKPLDAIIMQLYYCLMNIWQSHLISEKRPPGKDASAPFFSARSAPSARDIAWKAAFAPSSVPSAPSVVHLLPLPPRRTPGQSPVQPRSTQSHQIKPSQSDFFPRPNIKFAKRTQLQICATHSYYATCLKSRRFRHPPIISPPRRQSVPVRVRPCRPFIFDGLLCRVRLHSPHG